MFIMCSYMLKSHVKVKLQLLLFFRLLKKSFSLQSLFGLTSRIEVLFGEDMLNSSAYLKQSISF